MLPLVAAAAFTVPAGMKMLAERVPENRARLLVLVLAPAGGLTTLAKGLWGL